MSSTAAEFCALREIDLPAIRMSSFTERKMLSTEAVRASMRSPCATLESRVLPTAPSHTSRLSARKLMLSFSETTRSLEPLSFPEMSVCASW